MYTNVQLYPYVTCMLIFAAVLLQKERLMRMRGEQVKSKKHQSADDLDDG